MKEILKKLSAYIIAMTMAITPTQITANAEEINDLGTWGENITWEISGTTLTINGEGVMKEIADYANCYHNKFQNAPASITADYPWSKYYDVISDVVIDDGITSVAEGAFCYYPELINVTLPDSLDTIGANAFTCCKNLKEITIPENTVITADEMAGESFGYYTSSYITENGEHTHELTEMNEFYNAEKIYAENYNLTINGYDYSSSYYFCIAEDWITFNSIGAASEPFISSNGSVGNAITWTFSDLGTITFSGTGAIKGDDLNDGCSDIMPYVRKVVFENGITEIGERSFSFFDYIEEIDFSDTITEIGEYAFISSMNTMGSILIPESVTSLGRTFVYTKNGSIYGYSGTAAEKYALDNGINFISIDKLEQGDINCDGSIDLTDATDILTYYANMSAGSDTEFEPNEQINKILIDTADVNGDGTVDVADAALVLETYSKSAASVN
ncbi:MAG: leucine-rich repeat protein [Oscillospiraceae bacterium]|nr:leucine-rich repeat protein [Oscillospiraceae bacterium]